MDQSESAPGKGGPKDARGGEGGVPEPRSPGFNPGGLGGRPEDARRRRGGSRRQAGFNDGVDRSFCFAFRHTTPPDFPVQHRVGVATIRPWVVARRPGALLLCDGAHEGHHRWPGGEEVVDEEVRAAFR